MIYPETSDLTNIDAYYTYYTYHTYYNYDDDDDDDYYYYYYSRTLSDAPMSAIDLMAMFLQMTGEIPLSGGRAQLPRAVGA